MATKARRLKDEKKLRVKNISNECNFSRNVISKEGIV